MKRALVIYGDQSIGNAIATGVESAELARLRAKLEMHEPVRQAYYREKVAQARKKYYTPPLTRTQQRIWGFIGLMVLLFRSPQTSERRW